MSGKTRSGAHYRSTPHKQGLNVTSSRLKMPYGIRSLNHLRYTRQPMLSLDLSNIDVNHRHEPINPTSAALASSCQAHPNTPIGKTHRPYLTPCGCYS